MGTGEYCWSSGPSSRDSNAAKLSHQKFIECAKKRALRESNAIETREVSNVNKGTVEAELRSLPNSAEKRRRAGHLQIAHSLANDLSTAELVVEGILEQFALEGNEEPNSQDVVNALDSYFENEKDLQPYMS